MAAILIREPIYCVDRPKELEAFVATKSSPLMYSRSGW
jgi:hypothetical protein